MSNATLTIELTIPDTKRFVWNWYSIVAAFKNQGVTIDWAALVLENPLILTRHKHEHQEGIGGGQPLLDLGGDVRI